METEASEDHLAPVEREWSGQIKVRIYKSKSLRHYANDFPGLRINRDVSSNDRPVSTETPLPIPVAQHYPYRTVRYLIHLREPTPDCRGHAKCLEHAIAYRNRPHLFGLRHARDVSSTSDPDA